MAKLIEYDVSGVEESTGGTGVKVKPGVRVARIARAIQRTEKNNGEPANDIELALDVGSEYDWVFTYVGLGEASDWKLAELVRALGMKDKGKLDPDKLVDKILRVKINHDTYDGQYSPRAGKLFKPQAGDEDLLGQGVAESATSNGDGPVEDSGYEPSYADGFEPSRESDPEVGSYDDWEEADLLAEVEDRGLTLPGGRGAKKKKAIEALREEDGLAEGDTGGEAATSDQPADDYDDWDLDKLKAEWEDRNLGDLPSFRGKGAADRLTAAIIEALREDDAENPFSG